ncbi:hypothetical protein CPB85DRAFT_1436572 [Mucidula mucida]|nr:hypothetical protein CPB85DRAFT_1436572 [Mucidula mucida]
MYSVEKSGRIMLPDEPPIYDEVGSGQPISSSVSLPFLSPCLGLRGLGRSGKVKHTVTSLLHDIVQPVKPAADSKDELSLDIVLHCARACAAHSIDFGSIIQRPSMENHSPLYWAVVNGRDENLVLALLRQACLMSEAAQSESRLGCLVVGATALFDAISHELHVQMNYIDRMLLTANAPPDVAKVHKHPESADEFDVFLEVRAWLRGGMSWPTSSPMVGSGV